jgi:hypothetical protein
MQRKSSAEKLGTEEDPSFKAGREEKSSCWQGF